jgi:hypothetical protein
VVTVIAFAIPELEDPKKFLVIARMYVMFIFFSEANNYHLCRWETLHVPLNHSEYTSRSVVPKILLNRTWSPTA